MDYFTTTFSHLKVRAIRYNVQAQLKRSIAARAAKKGLEVKKAQVINVTYNNDWTSR
jgi:hypothetical protein